MMRLVGTALFLLMLLLSNGYAYNANKFYQEDLCKNRYVQEVNNLLQFLYKFDGNLPEINESKKKRFKYLTDTFENSYNSKKTRKAAFDELENDPDYWQLKTQVQAKELINQYEKISTKNTWEYDKEKIMEFTNAKGNIKDKDSLQMMSDMVVLIDDTREFFNTLEEAKVYVVKLGDADRFQRALANNQHYYFDRYFYIQLPASLVQCQIDYLEYAMKQPREHLK